MSDYTSEELQQGIEEKSAKDAATAKANEAEREARLALVESTARVLEAGLQLLGIRPLERM